MHPLNVENFVELKKKTSILIASGERIYTRQDSARSLRSGSWMWYSRTCACAAVCPGEEDLRYGVALRRECSDPCVRQPDFKGGGSAD